MIILRVKHRVSPALSEKCINNLSSHTHTVNEVREGCLSSFYGSWTHCTRLYKNGTDILKVISSPLDASPILSTENLVLNSWDVRMPRQLTCSRQCHRKCRWWRPLAEIDISHQERWTKTAKDKLQVHQQQGQFLGAKALPSAQHVWLPKGSGCAL